MRDKKIYLSGKQVEELISVKRIVLTPENLKIDKATSKFKFSLLVDEDEMIQHLSNYILFLSAVKKFEIPVSEENLFLHHLRIPKGLVETVKRKTPKDEMLPEMDFGTDGNDDGSAYLKIRRGLNELVWFGYVNESYRQEIVQFIQKLSLGFTEIQKRFINKLKNKEHFPQLIINQIKSNEFFRFIWWGKFIADEVFSPIKDKLGEKKLAKYKNWLKSINVDDLLSNKKIFNYFPEPIQKERPMLLGYLLTASLVKPPEISFQDHFIELLKSLQFRGKEFYEILFWGIMFHVFFDETSDFVFPNPLIRSDIYEMEKLAFDLASSLVQTVEKSVSGEKLSFKFKNIDEKELILNYYFLLEGKNPDKVTILDQKEVMRPFGQANLFRNNINKIGFINEDLDVENRLLFDEKSFTLRGNFSEEPIVYYGNLTTKDKEMLKNAGVSLKVKPAEKLIDKNKKVLVGFLSRNDLREGLVKFYRKVIEKTNLAEFIFVWMINSDKVDLQSTEFALKKDELKTYLEKEFGVPVKIFVKSPAGSQQEISRNLKLAMKDYQIKNIEVIDHNFSEEQAEWILLSSGEFVIKKEDINYYKILSR